jgi:hypothetical protein
MTSAQRAIYSSVAKATRAGKQVEVSCAMNANTTADTRAKMFWWRMGGGLWRRGKVYNRTNDCLPRRLKRMSLWNGYGCIWKSLWEN